MCDKELFQSQDPKNMHDDPSTDQKGCDKREAFSSADPFGNECAGTKAVKTGQRKTMRTI